VLDPAGLADADWPRKGRPAEAVGVLDLSHDAEGRLEVCIAKGVVLIKNARGEELVRIDAYATTPKPEGGVVMIDGRPIVLPPPPLFRLEARDEHKAIAAALSPKADRLVVLGHTTHTPGWAEKFHSSGESGSGDWAQVWRWEGDTLTPLEAQSLEEGAGARAVAFSADGKLLAMSRETGTDIWALGDKGLEYLGNTTDKAKKILFAPDSRSLAVIRNQGSVALYDLGPILPGESSWARWRFLTVALGLAAAAVVILVSEPTEGTRARRRLRIAKRVAIHGAGACVAWWAWRPVPAGAPLTVGLGLGAALVVLLILGWVHRRWPENRGSRDSGEGCLFLVTVLGALVCLGVWIWQFWWPPPSLLTPSGGDLARADVKSACFSADGRELAAVRSNGRLSLFDVATGRETRAWDMPAGVKQPEFAPDGRHLLAVAGNKAYVLRLQPFDDAAFVLTCCEEVLRHDPRAVDALLARGHVRLHKGELDGAIADFTEVIAVDDKSAAAYHGRGLARTDRGDYAGARDDFAAALRLDPKLADAARRPAP
jgi:hypothetical protein